MYRPDTFSVAPGELSVGVIGEPAPRAYIEVGATTLVYTLRSCPPMQGGTCVDLVERAAWGGRILKKRLRLTAAHPVENLAQVRYLAASLGANEVHVDQAHLS